MKTRLELVLTPSQAADADYLPQVVLKRLRLNEAERLRHVLPVRRSIDARGKKPVIRLLVEAYIDEDYQVPAPIVAQYPQVAQRESVLVVGAGPAGYFAALKLIELGFRPIVLDRG